MKRWLVRICVLLLLGAIVNVAVALTIMSWSGSHVFGFHVTQRLFSTAEAGQFLEQYAHDDSLPISAPSGVVTNGWNMRSIIAGGPVSLPAGDEDYVVAEYSAGFPWWCIRRATHGFPRILPMSTSPLGLIWPGFAINTVFYAFVLWLLFAAPFALRRWRRIRRGLCPKCAYDLRGSADAAACPECGATK